METNVTQNTSTVVTQPNVAPVTPVAQVSTDPMKMSEVEFRNNINNPDSNHAMRFINDYMAQKIIVSNEQPAVEQTALNLGEQQPVVAQEASVVAPPTPEENPQLIALRNEIAETKRFVDTMRQRTQEEKEGLMVQLRETQDRYNELKETASKPPVQPRSATHGVDISLPPQTEDDDYTSEYEKTNRSLIRSLAAKLKTSGGTNDPELDTIKAKMKEIERYETERKENLEREKKEQRTRQLFDELKGFQKKYTDYSTDAAIEVLNENFIDFKKNIGWLAGAQTVDEIEQATYEFLNGEGDKATSLRTKAQEKGIAKPKEMDKLLKLVELLDMKNGRRYDPIAGKYEPILDTYGNPVRYATIEDAYKVVHYHDDITKARAAAASEFQNARQIHEQSAVVVDGSVTATPVEVTQLDETEIRRLINIPPDVYERDPALKQKVAMAYNKLGHSLPTWRRAG